MVHQLQLNSHKIKCLGVINFTPDSFSDGGKFSAPDAIKQQLQLFLSLGITPDIGFESTAPKNAPLTLEQELKRVDSFFDAEIVDLLSQFSVISIDTYRFETFQYIRSKLYRIEICIWNDISGCFLDTELFFKQCPSDFYVCCINFARSRTAGSQHLNAIAHADNMPFFLDHFKKMLLQSFLFFESRGLGKRVIFDFCLGFAKTREQSQFLLKQMPQIMNTHKEKLWLVAISRKSFIRQPPEMDLMQPGNLKQVDLYQAMYLSWLYTQTKQNFIPRLHDPNDFFQFESFCNLL
jgi:dihydropteroate synthase